MKPFLSKEHESEPQGEGDRPLGHHDPRQRELTGQVVDGSGVDIYILDGGVRGTHNAFAGRTSTT